MGALIREKPGKKYGYWEALSFHEISSHGDARWWCKCLICGRVISVNGFTLRNGKSRKCQHCRQLKSEKARY